ncbi:MAG: long-chain fatty acid--CoA ligase [Ktedonobacteraceae bacterium]
MSDSSLLNNAQTSASPEVDAAFLRDHPWVRYYEQGVSPCLDVPDRPLTWLLDTTASRHPSHTAILYYGTKLTYAQLSGMANRFAITLQRLGIQKGDRVAIALPNIPHYPIAFYGALRAGAIVVPTNPLYTEREMQHQLKDSGARVLVMLDTFYPIVRAIRKETALEHIIFTSASDFLPPLLQTLYPLSQRHAKNPVPHLTDKELQNDSSLHRLHTMLETHTKGGIELFHLPVPATGDDLAVLQYTGGTTGLSKGAMLTHRNLLANAMQTRWWTPKAREAEEICLCVAPFFHSYGATVGMNLSIYAAATMVLVPRFNASDIVKLIRQYHPTLFPGIPTMYLALLREVGKHTDYLGSVKYCISGAAPLPAKVQTDFEHVTGGKLVEGYGLSEASPVTHCNPLTDNRRSGSIGLPLSNVDCRILDLDTGKQTPVGEIGEIVVKGPNIMQGYWNRDEETKAIFTEDGWMRTGDLGKMDEDGFFYVVERKKDMIIAGGFNVYPREVEEVLFEHSAVSEAAVAGVPDEYRGETVVAFVVLKAGKTPSEELRRDILAYCKQHLTAYKVPKILEFRDSLPKSLIGKVLRRELRIEKNS